MIKKVKSLLANPLLSGSFVMVGGSMGINVVNYIYHLLMGRILGPVDYGALAAIFSILYVITIIPVSTSASIVKFVSSAKNKNEVASVYFTVKRLILYAAVFLSIGVVVASPLIASFLRIEEIFSVVLIGPILFFSLVTLVNQSTLQGIFKFIGVVGPNFVSSVGKLVLGLLFVFWGWSVNGAVGAVFLGLLAAYFLSIYILPDYLKNARVGRKKKFELSPFLRYSFPVLVQSFAFTSFFTADLLLVKHFFPPFEAGIYAALSTLGKIIYFAAQPISAVMFPIVSSKLSKGEAYRKVFLLSFLMTVLISFAIVLMYYLFPNIAIGVLYGKNYLVAKGELVWMGIFVAIYTINYLIVNFLLSINKTRVVILPVLIAFVQIVTITARHGSILQVVQICVFVMIALFLLLFAYVGYDQAKVYAKK